jgi:recombination protein RecR
MKQLLPKSLQALVSELARFPGVGERTALRYAVSIVRSGQRRIEALEKALESVSTDIGHCERCHFWTEANLCPICCDTSRTESRLCVVRDSPDVIAFEKFKGHPWRYHVLQGLLSPLSGVGPSQIRVETLFRRIAGGEVKELIVAVDPTVEGDATALFIRDQVRARFPDVKVTRTALGLPAGSSVEFLDPSTLENALVHRTSFE